MLDSTQKLTFQAFLDHMLSHFGEVYDQTLSLVSACVRILRKKFNFCSENQNHAKMDHTFFVLKFSLVVHSVIRYPETSMVLSQCHSITGFYSFRDTHELSRYNERVSHVILP